MDFLGIALGILVGIFAAPPFCFVLVKLVTRHKGIARLTFCTALTVLICFVGELWVVNLRGVVLVREFIGPVFFSIHSLLTLGFAPATACVLLLGDRNLARWWLAVAALCWVFGVFSIFYQFDVAETLYGVGGLGGPYSDTDQFESQSR